MKNIPRKELKNSSVRIRSFLVPMMIKKVMYLHPFVALADSLSIFSILEAGEMSLGMLEHTFFSAY